MKIRIAELNIEIKSPSAELSEIFRDYLTDGDCDFSVEVTKEDIEKERELSQMEAAYEGLPDVHLRDFDLEFTAIYRKIANKLPDYGAFVFHGSAIFADGEAYLFTAKSGTGKTTHSRLWLKNIPGSFIINGDKPILRLSNKGFVVFGTPWAGKEQYNRNVGVHLRAIANLNRAKENRIEKETFSGISTMLLQQCYRPREVQPLQKTIQLINCLGKSVDFYQLYCNMEDEAATVAYRGMKP